MTAPREPLTMGTYACPVCGWDFPHGVGQHRPPPPTSLPQTAAEYDELIARLAAKRATAGASHE